MVESFEIFAIDPGGLTSIICNYDIGPRYEGDDGLCGEAYNTNSLAEAVSFARSHMQQNHDLEG